VDGLRQAWQDQVLVIQVDVNRRENRPLIEEHSGQFTPTFILFDAAGEEIWRRTGSINDDVVHQQAETLLNAG
jgi:thioredoxin-related protein